MHFYLSTYINNNYHGIYYLNNICNYFVCLADNNTYKEFKIYNYIFNELIINKNYFILDININCTNNSKYFAFPWFLYLNKIFKILINQSTLNIIYIEDKYSSSKKYNIDLTDKHNNIRISSTINNTKLKFIEDIQYDAKMDIILDSRDFI
jgi:hypothetical protein